MNPNHNKPFQNGQPLSREPITDAEKANASAQQKIGNFLQYFTISPAPNETELASCVEIAKDIIPTASPADLHAFAQVIWRQKYAEYLSQLVDDKYAGAKEDFLKSLQNPKIIR